MMDFIFGATLGCCTTKVWPSSIKLRCQCHSVVACQDVSKEQQKFLVAPGGWAGDFASPALQ